MYLIEYVHITRKSNKKEYQLFSNFTEFTDFALKLSMCSNVQNIECFGVELKKKNLKTLSDITNDKLDESISNLSFIKDSVVGVKNATVNK